MQEAITSLTIGTRASPLARAQAQSVADALRATGIKETPLHPIETRGDKILDKPLAEIGGKGLFTAELTQALLNGSIDIAVHSLKDLPTQADETEKGLTIGAVLARASPYDVLIGKTESLDALTQGARIGTASLRRAAQIKRARPDTTLAPVRGNIATRLRKIEDEGFDALILAAAAFERLDIALPKGLHKTLLPAELMLPAAGQGALAVQCRADDEAVLGALAPLQCAATFHCVSAERAALAGLDGSCRTPIAAFARIENNTLLLHARLLSKTGDEMVEDKISGAPEDALALGAKLAGDLRARAPHLIL